jgi:hypothetical protein
MLNSSSTFVAVNPLDSVAGGKRQLFCLVISYAYFRGTFEGMILDGR